MKVWIDGAVVEGSQARIPVTDHGFLYGKEYFVFAVAPFEQPLVGGEADVVGSHRCGLVDDGLARRELCEPLSGYLACRQSTVSVYRPAKNK